MEVRINEIQAELRTLKRKADVAGDMLQKKKRGEDSSFLEKQLMATWEKMNALNKELEELKDAEMEEESDDEKPKSKKKNKKSKKQKDADEDYAMPASEDDEEPRMKKQKKDKKKEVEVEYAFPPFADANEEKKWKIIEEIGTPLWPKLSYGKSDVKRIVFDALFSLPAMRWAKWYKDLEVTEDTDKTLLKRTLKIQADAVDLLLVQTKSYCNDGPKDLIVWIAYCNERYCGNYAVDDLMKVREFIPYRVEASVKQRKNSFKNLEEETMSRAARDVPSRIGHLAEIQEYFDMGEITGSKMIKTMVGRYRENTKEAKGQPRDYAGASKAITKRLTYEQELMVQDALWSNAKDYPSMRAHFLYFFNHRCGYRGHELRDIPLGAIFKQDIREVVKPMPFSYINVSVHHVKNCHNDREHSIFAARAPHPRECGLGAFSAYLVYILDVEKIHPLFTTMKADLEKHIKWAERGKQGKKPDSAWWSYRMVFANDFTSPISYDTHAEGFRDAFKDAGITDKTAVTHILRHMNVKSLSEKGVPTEDIVRHMRWFNNNTASGADAYMATAVAVEPLLKASGWEGKNEYFCWRESNEGDIPVELLAMVMPELDKLRELADEAYAASGIDLSAVEFLKVLRWARKMFLEDAILMAEERPEFPAYRHRVFFHPKWSTWREEELQRTQARQDDLERRNRAMEDMISTICQDQKAQKKALEETRQLILSKLEKAGAETVDMVVEADTATVNVHVNASFDIVPTIPDIRDIHHGWHEWDTTLRPFFKTHAKPAWLATFGESGAKVQKARMDKMQPLFLYMDMAMEEEKITSDQLIHKLKAANAHLVKLTKEPISEGSFVKDWMRNLIQQSVQKSQVLGVLKEALEHVGLPLPSMTSKEMRQQMWVNERKRKR